MSETPRPLWELVEKWRKLATKQWADGDNGQSIQSDASAGELAAALRAWREVYDRDADDAHVYEIFEHMLGVPPKEPAQKDSISLERSAKG